MKNDQTLSDVHPVGQFYNAISPEESFNSSNELSDSHFTDIFERVQVRTLEDLFPSPGTTPTSDKSDPPSSDLLPVPTDWGERVRSALLDRESCEDHMNGILQKALAEAQEFGGLGVLEKKTTKQQNEQTQKSSIGRTGNKKSPKQNVTLLEVTERQIRNMFLDCYNDGVYSEVETVNGLPIKLTSKPEFAVWLRSLEGMLLTGVGKNKDSFDLLDAIRQCSAYMLVHLYYWVVTKSHLVENVYGIAVAGRNCKDMKRLDGFAVILLRLSLPTQTGGRLLLHQYMITHEVGFLDDLWSFTNRVCNMRPNATPVLALGQHSPALLQIPSKLLASPPKEEDGWDMVQNGTANLVLRFYSPAGYDYVQQHAVRNLSDWDEYTDQMGFPLFFKSKNHLGSHTPENLNFYLDSIHRRNDARFIDLCDAYKFPPMGTATGVYVLMADMGEPIHMGQSVIKDLRFLAAKFVPFMERVLYCQRKSGLVHGDIHIGNLVYDGNMFHLIDYDEAKREKITQRLPRTHHQRRVYNEVLAEEKDYEHFTKNQLINLFLDCWRLLNDPDVSDETISDLMEEYTREYEDGACPDAGTIDRINDHLCNILRTISSETPTPVSP